MATALFVTEERLKGYTGIDENVDPSDLYPYVLQAQDIYIAQSLGSKLYKRIKDDVVDNIVSGTPIDPDYKTLLDDYITPVVVHYAYWSALPHLKYRTKNKGVVSGNSEVADTITLEELQYLRNNIKQTAQFYDERLRDYLVNHSELYTEYTSYTSKDGMAPNRSTAYFTGLVIPGKYRKSRACDCGECEYCTDEIN